MCIHILINRILGKDFVHKIVVTFTSSSCNSCKFRIRAPFIMLRYYLCMYICDRDFMSESREKGGRTIGYLMNTFESIERNATPLTISL